MDCNDRDRLSAETACRRVVNGRPAPARCASVSAVVLAVALPLGYLLPELPAAAAADAATLERGRLIAEARCGRCHATGPADAPPARTPPFRSLGQDYPLDMLTEAARTGVVGGHDEMPMFRFEPDEAAALLSWIDHLNPGTPGYATRR